MLGYLSHSEIDEILENHVLARVAYVAEGKTRIMRVLYIYDGTSAYIYSADGTTGFKTGTKPRVYFDVEDAVDTAHWRTVIAEGYFEERSRDEEEHTAQPRAKRFFPRPWLYRIRFIDKMGTLHSA